MEAPLVEIREVPQAVITALFSDPPALARALAGAGVAPRELAMWARRAGNAADIEKLAGWLSVGQEPGRYKPLMEAAATHLRAGEPQAAHPVFRWAYRLWRESLEERGLSIQLQGAMLHRRDGVKLLALWGECLWRLGEPDAAHERWRGGLTLAAGMPDGLERLAQIVESLGDAAAYERVLETARERGLPGAEALWLRWQRLQAPALPDAGDLAPNAVRAAPAGAPGCAIVADVANLGMVARVEFGFGAELDYGLLSRESARHGPLTARLAFVPDIPETLGVREHLVRAGFTVELQAPKRSRGRMSANADAAIAAAAVRWAAAPGIGRVELWTGDRDFLKVREIIASAWPRVTVAFRSFLAGAALDIQRLGPDWEPIGRRFIQA